MAASLRKPDPVVLQARGVVHHEARGLDFGGHFGQLELHSLELGHGAAELLPLLHVPEGVVEGALGKSHHLRADPDPSLVERLDRHPVPHPDLAEHILFGDPHVVEDQLSGGGGPDAELVSSFLPTVNPGVLPLDEKGGDPLVPQLGLHVARR